MSPTSQYMAPLHLLFDSSYPLHSSFKSTHSKHRRLLSSSDGTQGMNIQDIGPDLDYIHRLKSEHNAVPSHMDPDPNYVREQSNAKPPPPSDPQISPRDSKQSEDIDVGLLQKIQSQSQSQIQSHSQSQSQSDALSEHDDPQQGQDRPFDGVKTINSENGSQLDLDDLLEQQMTNKMVQKQIAMEHAHHQHHVAVHHGHNLLKLYVFVIVKFH